jgi:hypothetical protein
VEDAVMSKQLIEEDPMKRKLNTADFVENSCFCDPYVGLVARLHSALGGQNRCGRDPAGKTKEFDTPKQASIALFRRRSHACPERDSGTRQHRPRQFRRSGGGQKSGGRICCDGEREEFS